MLELLKKIPPLLTVSSCPPSEIVRYFEIIKEKWPELEIPFEKIVKVGAAYHEIGEYERSFLVFRATVESSSVTLLP